MDLLNRDIVYKIKKIINDDDLDYLKEFYAELQLSDKQINYDYIFQKAYLHSCLLHRTKIIEWLMTLFDNFDIVAQIGLKHIFSYGRHLQQINNPYLANNSRYK